MNTGSQLVRKQHFYEFVVVQFSVAVLQYWDCLVSRGAPHLVRLCHELVQLVFSQHRPQHARHLPHHSSAQKNRKLWIMPESKLIWVLERCRKVVVQIGKPSLARSCWCSRPCPGRISWKLPAGPPPRPPLRPSSSSSTGTRQTLHINKSFTQ